MGKQLIFCVEANSESQSDYIYIKNTIEYFYIYDRAQIKLSPVYMGSKWRYNNNKVIKQIEQLKRKYKSSSKTNETDVFFCVDCDDYDVRKEDSDFLDNITSFCAENNYMLIWFCKEIESVFLEKRINDNEKKKSAEWFARQHKIAEINQKRLYGKVYKEKYSNICSVLDEYIK